MNPPQKLYQYRAFSTLNITNVRSRSIWFSKPQDFNDPYDCCTAFKVAEPTPHEVREYYESLKQKHFDEFPHRRHQELRKEWSKFTGPDGLPNEKFCLVMQNEADKLLNALQNNVVENGGVCCFSEKCDHPLMRSHYAEGHRGFCLEFDTRFEPFDNARKVNYALSFPVIRVASLFEGRSVHDFISIASTKHESWTYESEWRLFHENGRQAYSYGIEALTRIYFGSKMSDVHRDLLCHILEGSETELYQIRASKTDYSMTSALLTYEPYDLAKHAHGRSKLSSKRER